MPRGQGAGKVARRELWPIETSNKSHLNKHTHNNTHTHLQRDYYNTYAPYNSFPITHSPHFTVPSSLHPHVHRLLVVQHIHSFSFVSLRFVLFSLLLCLSVFLAFLRVSGLRSPFLRFSQQFLLYDFILSSFYAFFMLDLAVFSLCWPTNPPMAVPSPQEQRSQFLGLSSSRVPDASQNTVQYGSLLARLPAPFSVSVPLSLSVSLAPLNKWITTRPVRFSFRFAAACCGQSFYYLCII